MKLLGENETEAVLQRLDRLNNEEARTDGGTDAGGCLWTDEEDESGYGRCVAIRKPAIHRTLNICLKGGKTSTEDIRQALGVLRSALEISPADHLALVVMQQLASNINKSQRS